jgi:phosphoribosylaminoimidazole carboxylase (NCAIR synthetase)
MAEATHLSNESARVQKYKRNLRGIVGGNIKTKREFYAVSLLKNILGKQNKS